MTKIFFVLFLVIPFAYSNPFTPDFIVAQDGSGNFTSIQAALDALPFSSNNPHIIFIKNGIYNEKIFIEKNNVVLIGESRDSTKIIYAELRENWRKENPSDYGSAVINIRDNVTDIAFVSLTVHNNYGALYGNNGHQFAIRGGSGVSRIIIDNCNIIADGGDTLSLWNTCDGMYYHRNSYFEGYVDYVCPRGYCYIENSRFFGHNLTASIWHDGSGKKDHKFVIKNSRFDGAAGFPLGRFHRDAQFFLIGCTFSSNMADKKIFFNASTPQRILQWGEERTYFYNCHGDSIDYSWHKNNLEQAEGSPKPEEISIQWAFNNLWDPEVLLNSINKE